MRGKRTIRPASFLAWSGESAPTSCPPAHEDGRRISTRTRHRGASAWVLKARAATARCAERAAGLLHSVPREAKRTRNRAAQDQALVLLKGRKQPQRPDLSSPVPCVKAQPRGFAFRPPKEHGRAGSRHRGLVSVLDSPHPLASSPPQSGGLDRRRASGQVQLRGPRCSLPDRSVR